MNARAEMLPLSPAPRPGAERPLRVAHLIDSGGLYGAERVVLSLMAAQRELGIEPRLVSLGHRATGEKAIEAEARARGLSVVGVRMRDGLNLVGAWRVLRELRTGKVQLLHLHGYKADILFGGWPTRLRKIPAVATIHGWIGGTRWNRMWLYEWLDAQALGRVERVVLVSRAMLDHPRVRGRRWQVAVVPNAIDRVTIDATASARRHGGPLRLISVGRLSPEKGHSLLLSALAAVGARGIDAQLTILGEGPQRAPLAQQASELGIAERVELSGWVDDVARRLEESDLFVLPSMTEGLPLTVLEAMAHGLPVIASAVGGIPELLADGAGRVVVPGSVEALTAEIAALAVDPAERRRIGERARAAREASPGPEVMARSYFDVYREAMRDWQR